MHHAYFPVRPKLLGGRRKPFKNSEDFFVLRQFCIRYQQLPFFFPTVMNSIEN